MGSEKEMLRTTSANSSSIPSIRAEWKAWDTASRLTLRPLRSHAPATAATASSSPDSTTEVGPFTAAQSNLTLIANQRIHRFGLRRLHGDHRSTFG